MKEQENRQNHPEQGHAGEHASRGANAAGAPEAPQKPPLFKTWNGMYISVLVLHAVVIAALYFLTLNYQ